MPTHLPTRFFNLREKRLPLHHKPHDGEFYECETASEWAPTESLRAALTQAAALAAENELLIQENEHLRELLAWQERSTDLVARLTPRQHQIMGLVLAGMASKNIASKLNISQRTVENHRAAIMKKTNSNSLPALVRVGLAASIQNEAHHFFLNA